MKSIQFFSKRFNLTEFLQKLIWGTIFSKTLHSVEKREIHCHANFFPSMQFIVKFFSKTLIWRNFGEKRVTVKSRNFHSVYVVKTHRGFFGKNFVKKCIYWLNKSRNWRVDLTKKIFGESRFFIFDLTYKRWIFRENRVRVL